MGSGDNHVPLAGAATVGDSDVLAINGGILVVGILLNTEHGAIAQHDVDCCSWSKKFLDVEFATHVERHRAGAIHRHMLATAVAHQVGMGVACAGVERDVVDSLCHSRTHEEHEQH